MEGGVLETMKGGERPSPSLVAEPPPLQPQTREGGWSGTPYDDARSRDEGSLGATMPGVCLLHGIR